MAKAELGYILILVSVSFTIVNSFKTWTKFLVSLRKPEESKTCRGDKMHPKGSERQIGLSRGSSCDQALLILTGICLQDWVEAAEVEADATAPLQGSGVTGGCRPSPLL